MKKLITVLFVLAITVPSYALTYGVDDAHTMVLLHMDEKIKDSTGDGTRVINNDNGASLNVNITPDDDTNFPRPDRREGIFAARHPAPNWMMTGGIYQPKHTSTGSYDGSKCVYFDGGVLELDGSTPDGARDGMIIGGNFVGDSKSPVWGAVYELWNPTHWASAAARKFECQFRFKNNEITWPGGENEWLIGAKSQWEVYATPNDGQGDSDVYFAVWDEGGNAQLFLADYDLDDWNHVRVGFDENGGYLEVNGVAAWYAGAATGGNLKAVNRVIELGSCVDVDTRTFSGWMDEVQIWTIPEPATMALIAVGGLLIRRRR